MFGAKISNVVKKYVRVDVQKAKITCRGAVTNRTSKINRKYIVNLINFNIPADKRSLSETLVEFFVT